MASFIADTWIHATALIETPLKKTGTGFFVKFDIRPDEGHIFLVTNKHVIGKDAATRQTVNHIFVHMNVDKSGKTVAGRYRYNGLRAATAEHPDPNVDILAINVTDLISGVPNHKVKWTNFTQFADRNIVREEDITIGDEIMVIGYPLGLQQGQTAYPLVRQGIIATIIGQRITESKASRGPWLPAFRIDGGVVPGSSGSPVVLKPVTGRRKHGNIELAITTPWLLGIIATTRPVYVGDTPDGFMALAGLGTAFDAWEIRKTIETYYG